jgi:hypothetical protein
MCHEPELETASWRPRQTVRTSGPRFPRLATCKRVFSLLLNSVCGLHVSLFAIAAFVMVPYGVAAQTESSLASADPRASHHFADDSLEGMLSFRGLVGNNLTKHPATIAPPLGTEVDETVQRAKQDGKTVSRTSAWTEELNDNALHVELTNFPSRQSQVAFWVLPNHSPGCRMFGRTMYDTNGRALQSEFWRNDRELKITGAEDFPPDLYPEALPAIALTRVVDFSHQGASGKIDQQISPYGFVDQQITVKDSNELQVPAGRFAAVRVDSQANASSILPTWPRFTLGAVSPFLPQTIYYFQADSPQRLLRKEQAGTPFIGGPEAITELVRYYVAGTTASKWPGPVHQGRNSAG